MSVEELHCSVLSMTFFDRIFDSGIAREHGLISKCFDEFYEDYVISDELRKVKCIFCVNSAVVITVHCRI